MARLTSDFWVSAYLRQAGLEGLVAVLRRRGAREAGAIFVKLARLDGTADLYGPVPQIYLDDVDAAVAGGRVFERLMVASPEFEVEERLASERRFDSDCWVVETEDRTGEAELDVIET